MDNTTLGEYNLNIVVKQQALPLFVATVLLIWSVMKTVKFFQKFCHNNMEPAVLLELVFLVNLPTMMGLMVVMRILALANLSWLIYWFCVQLNLVRISLFGDSCLVIIDKFVALYWSAHYKETITNFKASIACITSKLVSLIWSIISTGSYR